MLGVRNNMKEPILSFHNMGPRDWTQVLRQALSLIESSRWPSHVKIFTEKLHYLLLTSSKATYEVFLGKFPIASLLLSCLSLLRLLYCLDWVRDLFLTIIETLRLRMETLAEKCLGRTTSWLPGDYLSLGTLWWNCRAFLSLFPVGFNIILEASTPEPNLLP